MSNIPNIRFDSLKEEWKLYVLGNIGNTYTSLSGKTKDDFGHGDARYVSYMNVFTNPIANISLLERIEIDKKQNVVKTGDVFFTTSSETPDEVGMSSVWTHNLNNIYLNSFCFGYRPNMKIDPYFLAYNLRAPYFRNKISFLAQGISRYNISKNSVMDLEVAIPNINEQEKIGKFFKNIDSLIENTTKKKNKLIDIKMNLLKNMYIYEKKTIPSIRFNTFKNEWSMKNVGDNSNIIAGGTPSTNNSEYWFPKQIPWLSSGEVHKKRINNTDDMISEIGFKNSNAKWIPKNSVLIALAGQGKTRGTVAINEIELTTNQSIAAMNFNKLFDSNFVYYNIESRYQEIRELSAGDGSRGGLNKQMIAEIEIPYTDIKEQERIGNFFKELDKIINLYDKKIEKLKNLKRTFLVKMYI